MANILLVDDEPDMVTLTRMILEREGHFVEAAKDSIECFEKLKKKIPDLILLDVMMPGDDGWEVCRKIKEEKKTKGIPIAMFTVRSSDDSVEKSFKYAHADAQINKPFEMNDLIETVESLLKKSTLKD